MMVVSTDSSTQFFNSAENLGGRHFVQYPFNAALVDSMLEQKAYLSICVYKGYMESL